jgi:hypothetical protein
MVYRPFFTVQTLDALKVIPLSFSANLLFAKDIYAHYKKGMKKAACAACSII